jgi:hypothetical protein
MNPYQSPCAVVARERVPFGIGRALASIAIALSTVLAVAVMGTREFVPRMFDELAADLPAVTQLCLSASFAIAVIVMCLLTIAKERILKRPVIRTSWNVASIALVLFLAVMYLNAMLLPFFPIGERLG